jgi:hypothetical protein
MDEKVASPSACVVDPEFGITETREDDKIEATVTEKATDIENDHEQDEKPLQSEFLEVRAAAEVGDDENMPAETFRSWTIGIVLTMIGAIVSNITHLRNQPLTIDSTIIQLIALPIGRAWEKYMPKKTVSLGKWSFKLNPGTFTIKEHALIVIMANVGAGEPPYAIGLVIVQIMKYR